MKPTTSQIERTKIEYIKMAGENIEVQFIGSGFYVFGSELACLRVYYKNRHNATSHVGYSSNMKTWYYSHEISI